MNFISLDYNKAVYVESKQIFTQFVIYYYYYHWLLDKVLNMCHTLVRQSPDIFTVVGFYFLRSSIRTLLFTNIKNGCLLWIGWWVWIPKSQHILHLLLHTTFLICGLRRYYMFIYFYFAYTVHLAYDTNWDTMPICFIYQYFP